MKTLTGKPGLRGLNAAQGELGWAVASLLAVGQMVPRIRPECDTLSMKVLGLIRAIGDPEPAPTPKSEVAHVDAKGANKVGHVSYLAAEPPPSSPRGEIGYVSDLAAEGCPMLQVVSHEIKPGPWIMAFSFPTETKRIVLGLLVFQMGWKSHQGTRNDLRRAPNSKDFAHAVGLSDETLLRARKQAGPFRHLIPDAPIHLMSNREIGKLLELVQKEMGAKNS